MLSKIISLFRKTKVERREIPPKITSKEVAKDEVIKQKNKTVQRVGKPFDQSKNRKHETSPSEKWTLKDFNVEPEEGKVRFHDLHLSNGILHAISDLKYQYCTPIQAGIMPHTLKHKDAIGRAQTGTGKTAAFVITAISKLIKQNPKIRKEKGSPRVLILAPTRELVIQIEKDSRQLAKYHNLNMVAVYGGMDYKKQMHLVKGKYIDIMFATPGRLIDFMKQKLIRLNKVEIFVLDEADRMLDMGFMPDIRKIEKNTPRKENRQTLFFSATFPDSIKRIAQQWTKDAVVMEIEPEKVAADNISQINYLVAADEKFKLLYNLLEKKDAKKVLLFCNRKDIANNLYKNLSHYGVSTTLLSGNIDQKKRLRRLDNFKNGDVRVLVATDVAGRGIHINNVSHVINYNLPEDPEDYVHRIGRTGRAGLSGTSISFACEDDSFQIPKIETFLNHKMDLIYPEDELLVELPPKPKSIVAADQENNVKKKSNYKRKSNSNPKQNKRSRNRY